MTKTKITNKKGDMGITTSAINMSAGYLHVGRGVLQDSAKVSLGITHTMSSGTPSKYHLHVGKGGGYIYCFKVF